MKGWLSVLLGATVGRGDLLGNETCPAGTCCPEKDGHRVWSPSAHCCWRWMSGGGGRARAGGGILEEGLIPSYHGHPLVTCLYL